MTEPKFKVGETLQHVASGSRVKMFVLGVRVETCYGGTQVHYECRMVGGTSVHTAPCWFTEIELQYPAPIEKWQEFADWLRLEKETSVANADYKTASGIREIAEMLLKIAEPVEEPTKAG